MQTIIIVVVILVYLIFLLRIAYRIIMSYDDSNPIKASSWIFVITFIPFLGLLAHIVFGRNLRKKKSVYERIKGETDIKTISRFQYSENEYSYFPPTHKKIRRLLNRLSHMPVFPGNQVEFYSTGQEKFVHLFQDLEQARDHIHILYYTFGGDETGQKFSEVIIRKRREGVRVRLIYDDVGSDKTKKKFFKSLQAQGIEVAVFSEVFLPKARVLQRVNYRNHRKIVVIDGKVGYTGGMNVKNEYVYGVPWGIWRDLHLRIEGCAAQGLQAIFLMDWYYCTKKLLQSEKHFPVVENCGNVAIQVVSSEPLGQNRSIMEGMFLAITQAKKSIYIQTPYFVPTAMIMGALLTASLSGVKVIMNLPRRSDNLKVQYASNSYLQQLLDCDIEIYQYNNGFIHSKLMIVDDDLTIAGSSNMDIRSFELNFEDCVFMYDKEVTDQAKNVFFRDLDESVLLDKTVWQNRTLGHKFQDAFFRLFSPFL